MGKAHIVKLGIDVAKGKVQNFSTEQGNEGLRKGFAKLMELSNAETESTFSIDAKTFRRHKIEIFEIIEEVIAETIREGMQGQFDGLVEYRNLAWGDKNLFKVPANNIFRVALVSDGNGNIRRQRMRDGQEFQISLDTYAIKIGEEFHRFLAGKVDWQEMVRGVAVSFARDLKERIYAGLLSSYGLFNTVHANKNNYMNFTYDYHVTGNLTEDQILEMAMHIEARTGEKVAIYGSKIALRTLQPADKWISEDLRNQRVNNGIYGMFAGLELREIPQFHNYNTDTFGVDNKMLLLLPQNADRMIKVVDEGAPVIQDTQGGTSSDMMAEYFVANRFGVSVITSKVFGYVKLP